MQISGEKRGHAAELDGTILFGICPACSCVDSQVLFSAQDRLYSSTSRSFKIVECSQCRLIRLSPQPQPSELQGFYPPGFWLEPNRILSGIEGFYRRLVLRDHLRFVERGMRESEQGGLVLDVGGGGGLFLRMLADRGHPNVVGLHFGLDTATVAFSEAGVRSVCGTLSRAPFPPGSCAAITLFHVLEHLYEPAGYLDAAHQLLAPDGHLYIQVPNASCWQFLLLGEHWSGLDVPRHLVHFRSRDLETLLTDRGFEILRRKQFSWRDNARMLATSLVPSLDPSIRRLNQRKETHFQARAKNLVFLALVLCALPVAVLESACQAGATVMIEARKKS